MARRDEEHPPPPSGPDVIDVVRREEELRTGTTVHRAGSVRVRKQIEDTVDRRVVPRGVEHADVERLAVDADHDSGEVETLEDGSLSIPVFEEQLVVTRRLVVRERIIVRKRTVTEEQEIEAVLHRERVKVEVDDTIADRVHLDDRVAPPPGETSPG